MPIAEIIRPADGIAVRWTFAAKVTGGARYAAEQRRCSTLPMPCALHQRYRQGRRSRGSIQPRAPCPGGVVADHHAGELSENDEAVARHRNSSSACQA